MTWNLLKDAGSPALRLNNVTNQHQQSIKSMIQEQIITKIPDVGLTSRKHVKIASNCKEQKHTPERNS